MAKHGLNGHVPGSSNRLQKMLAEREADAAAIRRVLAITGANLQESAERRAETTLAGAIKMDHERKKQRKPQDRPSPEERAHRQQIVRVFLARQPLSSMRAINGELKHRGVDLEIDQARRIMVDLRPEVERIGERLEARYRLRSGKGKAKTAKLAKPAQASKGKKKAMFRHSKDPNKRASQSFNGTTGEKARTVVQLVKDAGGLISVDDLSAKARAAGVGSLTGMVNYTRAGYLKRTRDAKTGKNAYRFVSMPPEPQAATQ